MNISIRLEEEKDFKIVEYMTREAFWDLYKPGCDEHLVLHKIRKVPAFVKELDFVSCDEDTIVGNIIYSRAKVLNEENKELKFYVWAINSIAIISKSRDRFFINELFYRKSKQLGYKGCNYFGNPDIIIVLVLSMLRI